MLPAKTGTKKLVTKQDEALSQTIEQWKKTQEVVSKKNTKSVCLLCRRKFASEEKLKIHEEKSTLHKENLKRKKHLLEAKLPISVAEPSTIHEATVAATVAGYVDRAGDRRKLFSQSKKNATLAKKRKLASSTGDDDLNREDRALYEVEKDNKGTKLLESMGWKKGEGLGKDGTGIIEPVRVSGTKS